MSFKVGDQVRAWDNLVDGTLSIPDGTRGEIVRIFEARGDVWHWIRFENARHLIDLVDCDFVAVPPLELLAEEAE